MDTMDSIPGATMLTSQLAQMSAEQIKAILPPDFLVKVQENTSKPASTKTFRRRAHLTKRHRPARDHLRNSINPLHRIAAANAAAANASNRTGRVSKAVNSFMCYRSYYNTLLKDIPQKEISPYLKLLWDREPFKAKWTLVAKAYSTVRDTVGKPHAPLARFLELVCPAVGLLDPQHYLSALNWIVTWMGQQRVFRQTAPPNMAEFPAHFQTTSMSERSIIELCVQAGYVTPETPNFQLIKIALEKPDQGMQFTVLSAKALCQENAERDPRLFAARALGIEPDHPFLQLSTSLPERLELDDGTDLIDMLEDEGILDGSGDVLEAGEYQYEWSGNMSQLFSGNEVPMDLNAVGENSPWGTIDVSDPLLLDDTLIEGGAAAAIFHDGRDENMPEMFNFWESF